MFGWLGSVCCWQEQRKPRGRSARTLFACALPAQAIMPAREHNQRVLSTEQAQHGFKGR